MRLTLVSLLIENPTMQLAPYYLKSYVEEHAPAELRRDLEITIRRIPASTLSYQIVTEILHDRPDIVGFSTYVWNIEKSLRVAGLLKSEHPEVINVFGGPEASSHPIDLLRRFAHLDYIVCGEGEQTFLDLLQRINGQKTVKGEVEGLCYQSAGGPRSGPARAGIAPLDRIPSPFLRGLVSDPFDLSHPCTETMRGCPYRCAYCYYHKGFDGIRYYSLDRVDEELRWILAKKPSDVYLMDPTFNANVARAKEVLRRFIRHNQAAARLHVEIRVELIDDETAKLLSQANCDMLEVGLQSTTERALRNINRKLDKPKFQKGMKLLRKHETRGVELHLIDSLPGETFAQFLESMDWAYSLQPDALRLMKLLVLPGTDLAARASTLGLEHQDRPFYVATKSPSATWAETFAVRMMRDALATLLERWRRSVDAILAECEVGISGLLLAWLDRTTGPIVTRRSVPTGPVHEAVQWVEFVHDFCASRLRPELPEPVRGALFEDVNTLLLRYPQVAPQASAATAGTQAFLWDGHYVLSNRELAISDNDSESMTLRSSGMPVLEVGLTALQVFLSFRRPTTPSAVWKENFEGQESDPSREEFASIVELALSSGALLRLDSETVVRRTEGSEHCEVGGLVYYLQPGRRLFATRGKPAWLLAEIGTPISLGEIALRHKLSCESVLEALSDALAAGVVSVGPGT